MSWIRDIFSPDERAWEDLYRNRWAHDRVVRSTHGVNCTGSCSWNVYVKQGIITWEMQALDYPRIDPALPPYEPRGCQRGISCSWYVYSPLRIKYPYIRGALLDLWNQALEAHPDDPVAAWASIVSDPEARATYQQARGKGGFRRASWDTVLDLLAAANIHTVKRHGPDRLVGFSPIPAMSMLSYAAGTRFLQLMGGVALSFYDWYCDLPPASPEIWGEQTDVAESADWFNSAFIAVVGSNVLMTRTPDAHFLVEARHRGTKVVVFSPDFSQTSKVAGEWVPIHRGQDGAFWLAVSHVILREFFVDRKVPYFLDYLKRYSDTPFLVRLDSDGKGGYRAGSLLRASHLASTRELENAEWKFFVRDAGSGQLRMPRGTVGHRWQKTHGQWNLDLVDDLTGTEIDPCLFLDSHDELANVEFPDFSNGSGDHPVSRAVPAMRVETVDGPVLVTTGFELLLASYGVQRDQRDGSWPRDFNDDGPYTPVWQERLTGIGASTVVNFARQFAVTAEKTEGRCSVIIGAGANHWYHNNLIYRACIVPLVLCGCVGKNGGGWNHYVGQEKLVPQASWFSVAFATDWGGPPRLQNAPSFHYIHSDQWRYDAPFREMCPVSSTSHVMADGHTADKQALAVRCGWLPCFPQFDRPNQRVIADARKAGASSDDDIKKYVVDQLRQRTLRFSMEDPDNPECYPRVWYIWRGNALQASAKGHEYFLQHYLGTHSSSISEEIAGPDIKEVTWHDKVDRGKMDLVVDLNFRMDTSALYSDIILPAATWYEKNDLNSTDMHSFIHPLQAAVPPCWESKSDWVIFRDIAERTSKLAERYLPDPVEDVVITPLLHDTPAEIAQPTVRDWARGECDLIPGKTMGNIAVVRRDYTRVFDKFVSFGPAVKANGLSMHGTKYDVADLYDEFLTTHPTEMVEGTLFPSLRDDRAACEVILAFAPETNGELACRAWKAESEHTGIDHQHLCVGNRATRYRFADLIAGPCRVLTTPFWSGITKDNRTYSAFCHNVEERIPWRTLTGRQQLYQDHEVYRAFGENLPVYKPRADLPSTRDLEKTARDSGTLVLNYLTPHGKWHIHSTYGDTLRMQTLSRGTEPLWINDEDAGLADIRDNDWVEVINDNGVVVTRACVSARLPRGICFIYHATERTLGVPKSPSRGNRRAGGHNSLTRTRLKPLFMVGGYAHLCWAFNYWGPPGANRDTFVVVRKLESVSW